jgi:hypothetical protein
MMALAGGGEQWRGKRPLPDSNRGWRICNPLHDDPNPNPAKGSGQSPESVAHQLPGETKIDPDLARVLAAWPSLPPAIRRAVLALVEVAPPAHGG